MRCTTCKREMVQLFLSEACDHCDFGPPKEKLHTGFVVYPKSEDKVREEYVFRTPLDAERWRAAAGRDGCEIRRVYSTAPFRWHLSRGSLRDAVLADHVFEVFTDHRFEQLPHRAFLAKGAE